MMFLIIFGSKIKMVMYNFCVFLNIFVYNINVNIIFVLVRILIGSNLKLFLGVILVFIKEDIFVVDFMFGQLYLFLLFVSYFIGIILILFFLVNLIIVYFNFFDLIICEIKLKLFFFLDKYFDYCININ